MANAIKTSAAHAIDSKYDGFIVEFSDGKVMDSHSHNFGMMTKVYNVNHFIQAAIQFVTDYTNANHGRKTLDFKVFGANYQAASYDKVGMEIPGKYIRGEQVFEW